MSNTDAKWTAYDEYLRGMLSADRKEVIDMATESYDENAATNVAYQADAKRNGETQGLLATREDALKLTVSVNSGDELYIGDMLECYGENWIVVEAYTDEYGLTTGTAWLCNHIFKFQTTDSTIYTYYGVIDDGSYSSATVKAITTSDAEYNIYMTLEDVTKYLYVDKRLAFDVIKNSSGEDILQVMKITWIDRYNQNYGEGSHLLKFRVTADVYNEEKDNLEELICDYIEGDESAESDNTETGDENTETETGEAEEESGYTLTISGKDEAKIGMTRTYTATVIDDLGEDATTDYEITWSLDNSIIAMTQSGATCKLSIPSSEDLVGETITLTAVVKSLDLTATKSIKVVTLG